MTFYDLFRLLMLVAYLSWLAVLGRELVTKPEERARFFGNPERVVFVLIGLVLFSMFIVGICVPAIGEIEIFSIGGQHIRIWGIGLVGSFAWLACGWRMANRAS
jgi:hypothetical protein